MKKKSSVRLYIRVTSENNKKKKRIFFGKIVIVFVDYSYLPVIKCDIIRFFPRDLILLKTKRLSITIIPKIVPNFKGAFFCNIAIFYYYFFILAATEFSINKM